jgi:hypothetical protein
MPSATISKLGDFVDRVSELRDQWGIEDKKELWFRGESKKRETSLQPTLYRPKKDPKDKTKFLPLRPSSELLEIEFDLYEEFQRKAVQLCSEPVDHEDWDWDAYFLMQHHNAPTRLLDWSDGALMALHFAIRNKEQDDHSDAVVYVLEPYRLMDELKALPERKTIKDNWAEYIKKHRSAGYSRKEWDASYLPSDRNLDTPSVPLLLEFPHITRRVAAQRSRFMVFGTSPDWLAREAERPGSAIREILIDATSVSKIRRDLREAGITESVIFPDLDGLGREMSQIWEERK